MPVVRGETITTIATEHLGKVTIPVLVTDELISTSMYDIANSPDGTRLPYLFVGLFNINGASQWFFSNARRHEEMKDVVEQHFGHSDSYIYGQAWFDREKRLVGKLAIESIQIFNGISDIPKDRFNLLHQMFDLLNPHNLSDNVNIFAKESKGSFHTIWSYNYLKLNRSFHKE